MLPFSLQGYVREQMLQAVAVIFKRGTVETKAKGREGLFNDVSQLIGSGDTSLVSQTLILHFITSTL